MTLRGPWLWRYRSFLDVDDLSEYLGPVSFGAFQGDFDAQAGDEVFWGDSGYFHFRLNSPAPPGYGDGDGAGSGEPGVGSHEGVAGAVNVTARFQKFGYDNVRAAMAPQTNMLSFYGSRCAVLCVL